MFVFDLALFGGVVAGWWLRGKRDHLLGWLRAMHPKNG
jgi:hypothetical protein